MNLGKQYSIRLDEASDRRLSEFLKTRKGRKTSESLREVFLKGLDLIEYQNRAKQKRKASK